MEDDAGAQLLVEAAILITATRLRIARSLTVLARVSLDGLRAPSTDGALTAFSAPASTRRPSTPSL